MFSLKAPYFVGGKETGSTCGLTDDLCSTMINNGVTWRMISTWGSTALTSATPLLVKVLVTIAQWCPWLTLKVWTNFYWNFEMCGLSVCPAVLLLRAEPTGGEDAWCLAPDSVQRWTNHQLVCRQRRWCPVRPHIHAQLYQFYELCWPLSFLFGLVKLNVLVLGTLCVYF